MKETQPKETKLNLNMTTTPVTDDNGKIWYMRYITPIDQYILSSDDCITPVE